MAFTRPKRILLLAASLGSGHLRAAGAIQSALHILDPGCQTEILDIRPLTSPALRFLVFNGYEFLIEHAPWAWRLLYKKSQGSARGGPQFASPEFFLRHGNKRLHQKVREFAPDVIVSTQINCHELAYFLSPTLPTKPTRVVIITDYDVHPIWSRLPVECIVVAEETFAKRLRDLNTEASSILSTGIPIDPRFATPLDRASLQDQFHLDQTRPTLLVMGGSVGFGELDRVVENLLGWERKAQILAVAGRNRAVHSRLEKLKSRIERHPQFETEASSSLQVFGFVDYVPELMTVADCFITKPGGLATTEALAKELPMVFINPIAGHEERNAEFFVQRGAAISVNAVDHLHAALNSLFDQDACKLQELQSAARGLAKPQAAICLARKLLEEF